VALKDTTVRVSLSVLVSFVSLVYGLDVSLFNGLVCAGLTILSIQCKFISVVEVGNQSFHDLRDFHDFHCMIATQLCRLVPKVAL
jgi:hypothetical protein